MATTESFGRLRSAHLLNGMFVADLPREHIAYLQVPVYITSCGNGTIHCLDREGKVVAPSAVMTSMS
eukprot:1910286-Prymnesium_polylepis.1